MEQVPKLTSLTVAPETVHTSGVVEVKLTGRPELTVALTVNGAVPNEGLNGWLESVPKAMVWIPCVTWKLWMTGVAAVQLVLPGWVAWMVQAPRETSVTVDPDIVQTAEVVEAKPTGSPDEAFAPIEKGEALKGSFESAPKVIMLVPDITWKLWLTGVAALQLALPGCVAWMVQAPAAIRVTVVPETVQTAGVVEAKLTARLEEAVALTVNGAAPYT